MTDADRRMSITGAWAQLMQKFLDNVVLTGVKETSEGYLIADALTVRTGIQRYAGYEVGRPDLSFVDVYRAEDEVFSVATLQSFSHVPVTNDHPTVAVTSDNWKDLAVGEASTDVLRDGERMRIPLVLKDKSAIADVRNGKRELSAGYSCDLVFGDGLTADGQSYGARQTNIRANHVAIVQRGRAGSAFRIGDSGAENWGAAPLTEDKGIPMNLKTILHDGISIQVTDQGEQAINKLQRALDESTATNAQHAAAVAAKDTEIGTLKVELQNAKDSVPSGAALDKLVADRATLLVDAAKIAKDVKFDGMTDADIRKAAVSAKYGADMVKDASDAHVAGMFAAAVKDSGAGKSNADAVAVALKTRDGTTQLTAVDNGQSAYEKRMSDAWKGAA